MKKYFLLSATLLVLIAHGSFAQSKSVNALFQKYKAHENFFHMDLGGSFMNFAKGLNLQLDSNQKETLVNSMERMKLFKLPVTGVKVNEEYNSLLKGLKKENFEVFLEAHEKKNGVLIYTKGGKTITDVVVLVKDEKQELMVFELLGSFDSKLLSDIGYSNK